MNLPNAGCGEDVAAYALGALDDEQARDFQRHLRDCELCRTDLATLSPVIESLPASAEPVDPPPELKKRIMAVVEAEARQRQAAERPARAPRFNFGRLPSFAAAAACAIALAAILVTRGGEDDPQVLRAKVKPPGSTVEMRVDGDGGTLVVKGMPRPEPGRVYQVWEQRGTAAPEPTSALFTPRSDGTASVSVPGDMKGVDQVLVSDEPPGGSERPSSVAHIVIET